MHGIQRSIKPQLPPTLDAPFRLESGLFSTTAGDTSHALFCPLHYEAGYAYPLIVWLHGEGEDERQLLRIMPLVSAQNYVAVAPRGILPSGTDPPEPRGFGWRPHETHVLQAEERVFHSVEIAIERYHVARHRIYLAGFDTGGTMAFRLALKRPERFAGVLSLGGAFPKGGTPLGNLLAARRLPVFLAVGRFSRKYPDGAVCEDLRLLHSAGLPNVMLRLYPCGHELSPQMLTDMNHWIMEHLTACPEPDPTGPTDAERGRAGREARGGRQ